MVLVIDSLGGNCPVQAEGTIAGKPFYFRARDQHWSIGIGGDPVLAPEWYREQGFGDSEFAAGWMEEDQARRFIEQCAADFETGKPGRTRERER